MLCAAAIELNWRVLEMRCMPVEDAQLDIVTDAAMSLLVSPIPRESLAKTLLAGIRNLMPS